MKHIQARLKRGVSEMVAWIPCDCAIKGNVVDLDDPIHGETKGWTVIKTSTINLSSKWINERSRDYLNHRRMTDI